MNPTIKVKDGGVHIITGDMDQCECGIDAKGNARSCQDILQDMINRLIGEYTQGKVPPGPILLCEDTVAVKDNGPESPS